MSHTQQYCYKTSELSLKNRLLTYNWNFFLVPWQYDALNIGKLRKFVSKSPQQITSRSENKQNGKIANHTTSYLTFGKNLKHLWKKQIA